MPSSTVIAAHPGPQMFHRTASRKLESQPPPGRTADSEIPIEPPFPRLDAAQVRAQMDKAVALVGSATPSIQSAFNVQIGKYRQVSLYERIDNRCLPDIRVEDLTELKEEQGLRRFFTPRLIAAVQDRLARKEQVLLFLNRRGFANLLVCDL